MPARSRAQRVAMAIAEHHPEKLNPANRSLLKMSKSQLHDYAATPEQGLPYHAQKKKAAPPSKFSRSGLATIGKT